MSLTDLDVTVAQRSWLPIRVVLPLQLYPDLLTMMFGGSGR